MNKKTLRDINVSGQRVLVRVDFNVPLDKSTGNRADKETKNSIFEYYLEEHTPD